MQLFENTIQPEQALLVGLDTGEYDAQSSMDELEELAKTAGAQVVGQMLQKRDAPSSATYVGSGRLEEIREFCEANQIDLLLCDGELSPSQQRNMEDATHVRVVDRTMLILDIFAGRARSSEGKLQVELAQLRYTLPRLGGQGKVLSRLGAGIGTRGPGESKLESDRRHIRRRIHALEEELREMEERRGRLRERRKKTGVEVAAIVGYTNAGKSTLMNRLTQAGVLAEDKLFATLDPTARKLTLPDGRSIMLVDTVGLIRRLPHHLVEAFKSTLEEAAQADVILNVCDASNPECNEHLRVTMDLLEQLHCGDTPVVNVLNKCDLVPDRLELPVIGRSVAISALDGRGMDDLLQALSDALPPTRKQVRLLFPFEQGSLAALIRKNATVQQEEYTENGLWMEAVIDLKDWDKIKDFVQE